jgi:hypothetical protein
MRRNEAKLDAIIGEPHGEKSAAIIRRRMTLCGVVFMSLADAKRLGEEKS